MPVQEGFTMKTALITGASRGIGKECALELSKVYDCIAICSKNNIDSLKEIARTINEAGSSSTKPCKCIYYQGDVGDYEFVSSMVSSIIRETGSIDTLINNAGIASIGMFQDVSKADWDNMLSTNLSSIYNTCHEVIPHMIHQKSGRIINISSVWGLVGASCEVVYSATKGAINSFTKALAKELAPSNIAVNAIAFGAIDTDMNACLSTEELKCLEEEIPFGRMATKKEASSCIKQLLDMPSYMTGEIIKFDGGWI